MLTAALVLAGLAGTVQAVADRTVTGIVEDVSGGALPGAAVVVTCGDRVETAFADAAGRFRAARLPAAPCEVEARADGFERTRVAVDLTGRANRFVRLVLRLGGLQSEVVVTASRGDAEQSFAIPQATSVTTREEIESRAFQLLPQALREEPGILVQQTTTAQASPFIRGFSAQRIVYLVDGVRLNTSTFRAGATQYLGWIDANIVDRMEVVRGPASVQYGSDALGGTLNVLTFRPPFATGGALETSGTAELSLGSADLAAGASAAVSVHGRSAALRVGGSGRRVGDLRPGGGVDSHAAVTRYLGLPSTVLGTRLRDTGFRQSGAQVAASFRLGPASTLHATYLHEEQHGVSRYDRIWGGDGLHRSEFDPQQLDFAVVRYERQRLGPLQAFNASFSLNRQQDDRLEQARPGAAIEREFGRTLAVGYQAQASRTLTPQSVVTVGGEVYDEFIATRRLRTAPSGGPAETLRPEVPDGTRYTSAGLFGQIAQDVGSRLSLRGGARYGRFAFGTRAQPALGVVDESVVSQAVTFNSGVVVRVRPWLNLTGSVNRGFRAANALDLGGIGITGGGFEISTRQAADFGARMGTSDGADAVSTGTAVAALGPETLWAFELGARVQAARLSASITGFDLELRDAIQRRTAIFPAGLVGTTIAGYTIVSQDAAGRAFIAEDPRPVVTRVNVERARIRGLEADATVRITPAWVAGANFAFANGRDLDTGAFARRMPPPLGVARLKYEPTTSSLWIEGVVQFALTQERLSSGDLGDARIGARRTAATIARYFDGTATDLGLVRNGVLVSTGETLAEVQRRVLGGRSAAPLFTTTPGFVVMGARAGWKLTPHVDLTVIADNLADRNYRWHGSGVDAPGINLTVKTRVRF
ncbi:MAG: TonB-dependent receptor [Acidobacteriota bacterium]